MAKVRIGFSTHFEVENELVGIGTDNPTNTKQVLGNIHATNTKAIGITTLTTFDGFTDTKLSLQGSAGAKQHTTSGEIIIEGDVTVSSGTTFTSGPENLTVTDNFTLPGISDDKPSVGTTRYNENLGALEFYTGVEWRAVNSRVDMGNNGSRGFQIGGYKPGLVYKYVQTFNFSTVGEATFFGKPAMTQPYETAGFGSRTRAFNATDGSYFSVEGLELMEGELYSDTDSLNRNRVAVIGSEVMKELNLLENIDGSLMKKTISIGGTSFQVIGILKKKGSGGWNGPDERVFIPLLTGAERVMGHERLQTIRVSVPDEVTINEAMIEIERVLRSEHDIGPGDDNDFRIIDWSEIRQMQQETFASLTAMITGIASISLLVGGIGVMNIMLVSVTERTREIGLRKALGATPRTILIQFLIEAMMLCVIGGITGVLIGSLIVISLSLIHI